MTDCVCLDMHRFQLKILPPLVPADFFVVPGNSGFTVNLLETYLIKNPPLRGRIMKRRANCDDNATSKPNK